MRAILIDRFYQRRLGLILFLLLAAGLTLLAANHSTESLVFAYLILCIYWNGLIKAVGAPPAWKLLWSLPLSNVHILGGQILSYLLQGWAVNVLLFLVCRIWGELPVFVLLFACILSLVTDLFLLGMEMIPSPLAKVIATLAWYFLVGLGPLLFKELGAQRVLEAYVALPMPLKILPFVLLYLAGIGLVFLLYRRFRRTWEMAG